MSILTDPLLFVFFGAAIVVAFLAARFGRTLYRYLRGNRAAAPSGPPPSRQVRRAEKRRTAKRDRD